MGGNGIWLPNAAQVDLSASHGYGPFQEPFLGVIAHVNQGNTSDAQFAASTDVCPNFQVYADGTIHQYLPLDWQPWCQTDGNQQYAAIETAGWNTDPWTDAQVAAIATIIAAYRDHMGLAMQLAELPGQRGFGWHGMGGVAWGNHPGCPGEPRKAQRQTVLDIVTGDQDMPLTTADLDAVQKRAIVADNLAVMPTVQELYVGPPTDLSQAAYQVTPNGAALWAAYTANEGDAAALAAYQTGFNGWVAYCQAAAQRYNLQSIGQKVDKLIAAGTGGTIDYTKLAAALVATPGFASTIAGAVQDGLDGMDVLTTSNSNFVKNAPAAEPADIEGDLK